MMRCLGKCKYCCNILPALSTTIFGKALAKMSISATFRRKLSNALSMKNPGVCKPRIPNRLWETSEHHINIAIEEYSKGMKFARIDVVYNDFW